MPAVTGIYDYSAIDPSPYPGKSFYRLKIFEKDGSVSYSPTRQVEFAIQGFSIYPNPAKNKIIITGELPEILKLKLMDLSGRLVWSGVNEKPGSFIEIDLPRLNPGVYIIRLNETIKKLVIR